MRTISVVAMLVLGCDDGDDSKNGDDTGTPMETTPSGDVVQLEVDCNTVSSSAEVWVAVGDTVYEFADDETGAEYFPSNVPENERMGFGAFDTNNTPRTLSMSAWWQGDVTGPGTFSCADIGTELRFDDGAALGLIYGANPAATGSSCTIDVTAAGDTVDDAVQGTFEGVFVGLNAPMSAEFCGAINTTIVDVN